VLPDRLLKERVPVSDQYREDEKIITSYDPEIIKRLFSFLRSHWLPFAIALIALVITSAAELGMPVIVQRGVDQNLITNYVRIPADAVSDIGDGKTEAALQKLREKINFAEHPSIGGYYFVLDSTLTFLSGVQRDSLEEAGLLSREQYYIFPLDEKTTPVVESNRSLFSTGEEYGSILRSDLARLSREELKELRHTDIEGIKTKIGLFFVLLGTILVFMFLELVLMALTGQGIMVDLRTRLYHHIINQSLRFLNTRPVGTLVTRITNDVETINELFAQVLANLLKNVVMMIGVIVTLFLIDPLLAGVTMLTLPPVVVATTIFRKRARDAFRNVRRWVSRVNGFLSEHISGMPVVQMFVQEKRTNREFDEKNTAHMKANLAEMYVFAVFRPLIDLLSSVSIAVIIYFGAFFLLKGVVSLGVLVAFIDLIRRFYRQLMQISERFVIVQSALAGSERVFSLLDEDDRLPQTETKKLPRPLTGEVVFDRVWFSYKEDQSVIKELSFRVSPGETVAIVGYTGAGKTTIASLLARLWDIDSGSITVDGVDIRDVPLADLREKIQTIQQDVFLFRDTIEENIRLGADMSQEQIEEAAQAVQAHRFVTAMPEGYKTRLDENAANISTGQRQLLSFARVIAHDPRIIILDEATSSIDTETEKLIQEALQVVLEGRTSLVIAHRLSTIKNAHRIFVLSGGRLVEEGNHRELIAERGLYYNLYKLQYAGNEEQVP
jgi:ATP-binding cassette, subfamily B, multidrug efflux pump